MKRFASTIIVLSLIATSASATDRTVKAGGAPGSLVSIDQAMAVSSQGDRILVMPGSYPAFHFSRGVEVIGLGLSPGDVTIARVDFHPTIPTTGFNAALSNLTICGFGPADGMAVSGNELAAGTLVLEGVRACGGVFLHGAGQLYVLVVNSSIRPDPGDGFLGAAFDFAGGAIDVVDSEIRGSNAAFGIADAGRGLRLGNAARARITRSTVTGGDGLASGGPFYETGGKAVEQGFGSPPSEVRLYGQTVVRGGTTLSPVYHAGAGVDLFANIVVGTASVSGGDGAHPGSAYASSQPSMLGFDPSLRQRKARTNAAGNTFTRGEDTVWLAWGVNWASADLGYTTDLTPTVGAIFSPLGAATAVPFAPSPVSLHLVPEVVVPTGPSAPLHRVYMQGYFRDPETGAFLTTNPIAITLSR